MEEEKRELVEMKTKRKVGAPAGNQNARKHGFYSKVLTRPERRTLTKALDVDGLDNEIALLRVKLTSLIKHDPDNVELIVRALTTLARILMAKTCIAPQDNSGLTQLVAAALRDLDLPVGSGISKVLEK